MERLRNTLAMKVEEVHDLKVRVCESQIGEECWQPLHDVEFHAESGT